MTSKKWKNARNKRDRGRFLAIPAVVIDSRAYISLSYPAKSLLIDIFGQYRGYNNGELVANWKTMKQRGWKSQATLHRARKELEDSFLLVETRKGGRPNRATYYAVCWLDLDESAKLDITSRAFEMVRGKYKLGG